MLKKEIRNRLVLRLFGYTYRLFSKNQPYKNTYKKSECNHFIPRLILGNFKSSPGLIYEYKREDQSPSEVSIRKKAACIEDFYIFRDVNKQSSDFQEKVMFASTLEWRIAPIFNKIKKDPSYNPTDVEGSVIASFVAHQMTRTPLFRQKINLLLCYLLSEGYCKIDDLSKEFMKKQIVYNDMKIDMKKFRKFVLSKSTSSVTGARNQEIILSILIAEYMSEKILRKTFVIEEAEQGSFFLLSDHPAIFINMDTNRSFPFEWWQVSDRKILIFMPISPSLAIIHAKGRKRLPTNKMNKSNVNMFNHISMICSLNSIYSHIANQGIQKEYSQCNDSWV